MEDKLNNDEFIKIYPNYIDKDMKISEGRKINSEISVSNPHIKEIYYVCKNLGFECVMETKHYSQDWMKRGRVQVKFYKNKKETINSTYKTSKNF